MSYYKEVTELPFRDFTLIEFNKWKNCLVLAKIDNFTSSSFGDLMQVVYYHLAICNYHGVLFFLEKCKKKDKNDIQIKFLEIIIKQKGVIPPFPVMYRPIFEPLLELCLIKYRPALVLICQKNKYFDMRLPLVKFIEMFFQSNHNITINQIVNILVEIENNMIEAGIDIYFSNIINNKMHDVKSFLLHETRGDVGQYDHGFTTGDLIKMALGGSNIALAKIIKYDVNNCGGKYYGVLWRGAFDGLKLVFWKTSIQKLLIKKILDFDFDLILRITCEYRKVYYEIVDTLCFSHNKLIHLCIGKVFQRIADGGADIIIDHVKYYFKVHQQTLLNFQENEDYTNVTKTILTTLCKNGFMFLDTLETFSSVSFYKKYVFNGHLEEIKSLVPGINDLIINWFWFWHADTNIGHIFELLLDERKIIFETLLVISRHLLGPVLSIIGLDVINRKIYQPIEDNLISINIFWDVTFDKVSLCLLDESLQQISVTKFDYSSTFDVEVDYLELEQLQEKSAKLRKIVLQFKTLSERDRYNLLLFLYDTCEFFIKYNTLIDEHKKYQPGGECYEIVKDDFERKISNF